MDSYADALPRIRTALAAAKAQGRKEGLEEAAQAFDADVAEGETLIAGRDPDLDAAEIAHYRMLIRAAKADAQRIRGLAAAPNQEKADE